MQLVLGPLSDVHGRRRILLVALGGYSEPEPEPEPELEPEPEPEPEPGRAGRLHLRQCGVHPRAEHRGHVRALTNEYSGLG